MWPKLKTFPQALGVVDSSRPGWPDQTQTPSLAWSQWISRAVGGLAVMMALYVGVGFWTGWMKAVDAIRQMPVATVPTVVGLVLFGLSLRAWRWDYYTRRLGWEVPFGPSMLAFLASFAFTATPGKLGEVVKSVLLRSRYRVSLTEGVAVLLVERLGDLLAVLILAAGGMALLAHQFVSFVLSALMVGLATVFVGCRTVHQPVLELFSRAPKLERLAGRVQEILTVGRDLLRPAPFLIGVGLAIVAWTCEGIAFHLIIQTFVPDVSLWTSCCVFGVATLVGALSTLPGGLGSMEAVMVAMLAHLGLSASEAAIPVVLFRVLTLWFGSLLGFLAMLAWWGFCSSPNHNNTAKHQPTPPPDTLSNQPITDRLESEPQPLALREDSRLHFCQCTSWRRIMAKVLPNEPFQAATVVLPVVNETTSLEMTVQMILRDAADHIKELLIVVCERTTPESMATIERLQKTHGNLIVVHRQKLPFLGGAIREAFDLSQGSHTIMMASDLETDPALVPTFIEESIKRPQAIITASRWLHGGRFEGYSRVKLLCNWIFQRFFSFLYGARLTDMTYGYRLFPTRLVQSIQWEELRHPFLFETLVKPLRLGVQVIEIPAVWKARIEGHSQNTFLRNFEYFRIGWKTRWTSKRQLLKPAVVAEAG